MTTNLHLGRRAENIYHTLLREIEDGVFVLNSRLPTEETLCERFGASHNTVRKALARLISENRVISRQGSGSFVRPLPKDRTQASIISLMYSGDVDSLTQIQDMALNQGCVLSLFSQNRAQWSPALEASFLRRIKQQRHKALLAFCSPIEPRNDNLLADLWKADVRVIHIEPYRDRLPDENYIMPDYYRAGYAAAIALMLAGYERLYYAGMEGDGPFSRLQEQGFIEALREQRNDAGHRREFSRFGKDANFLNLPRMGADADAEERLDVFAKGMGKTSGILCGSCDRAIVMLEALQKRGVRIPEHAGVIGVETMGDKNEHQDHVDHMVFGRMAIFERAIEMATQPEFTGVRELVPPRLVHQGTVRNELEKRN